MSLCPFSRLILLPWLGWIRGLPWLRSQDWLLSGHDTEWSCLSIIQRCLCKASGGRRLLSRGMLQAGSEEKNFPLYLTLLELHIDPHQLGLWLVAPQAQIGRGLYSWLFLGMFSILGAQNLSAWIRSAENAARVPSLQVTAATAVAAGKGTEPSLGQSGDNCCGVFQCSSCFVEQHPHSLHDTWAGSIAVSYLSCPRWVPSESTCSQSPLPPRSASLMVPRTSATWWKSLGETMRTKRSLCLWQI